MIYYAPAIIMSFIMAYFFSTEYELSNGVKVKMLRTFKIAFLVLLPLAFVAAFRWDVGIDSVYGYNYWDSYQNAALGDNVRDFEPLFFLLMYLPSKMGLPYFWFLFIHCVIFFTCVSYALSKGSVSPLWSILIFFLLYGYFDCFSALRQAVAEGIAMVAIAMIGYMPPSKKKDIIITILFSVATCFHLIAIIYIPIYFISKIRFSRNGLLKFLVISVSLYPVIQILFRVLTKLLNEDEYQENGVALINLLMSFGILVLCWYFYDTISSLDENAYIYINISLIIFVFMLNSGALVLAFRYFDMLKISYMFIIPYLIKGVPNARLRLAVSVMLLMVFAIWFINAFFIQTSFAVEYHSVFDNWEKYSTLP